ncbi:MAG: c-type cytochrome [Comamonadaceae bacterium]|nr:c-type cytochrome [Comamonadaceae bacterium]
MFYITIVFAHRLPGRCIPASARFQGGFELEFAGPVRGRDEEGGTDRVCARCFDKYFAAMDLKAVAADPQTPRPPASACSSPTARSATARMRAAAKGFPNLTDSDWLYGGDPVQITDDDPGGPQRRDAAVRTGAGCRWGEGRGAVTCVRLSGLAADSLRVQRGKDTFQQNCVACHGPDGKGDAGGGRTQPHGSGVAATAAARNTIAETVTKGRNNRMPAFKEFLGDAESASACRLRVCGCRKGRPRSRIKTLLRLPGFDRGAFEPAPSVSLNIPIMAQPVPSTGAQVIPSVPEAPEDTLYEVRKKIYPRAVYRVVRRLALGAGLGHAAGLLRPVPGSSGTAARRCSFDLVERKFYIFGLVLWPQDCHLPGGPADHRGATSLFLFTAVAGRLWCGYACPQTGLHRDLPVDRARRSRATAPQRMKLDRAPLTPAQVRAQGRQARAPGSLLALWTGFTFVGYFTPIRELARRVLSFRSRAAGRRSGCCSTASPPTATPASCASRCASTCAPTRASRAPCSTRTRSIITYDAERGEPRGARASKADPRPPGSGDCVDCGICVQVCPTGIDIRRGPPVRVHRLRRLHRRLRSGDGQGRAIRAA